ncbi:MAG: ornithine carbamoyltransferase [Deltaproteobacteria bacterium]|nr:ornithine carbamoyltransferase [Deltaproteobacteria bacterium]MDL1960575.1 ornithine carbamoyltransferase [Deltaproteobacteria bacterium]
MNKSPSPRHFLTISDLASDEILFLINRALKLKKRYKSDLPYRPCIGKVLGLLFEKPSTRTRVSFEAAMLQLGGNVTFLSSRDLQLSRGEPLKDTARVLSRYLNCLVVRTFGQEVVDELARWSDVPVINGLTDQYHPCQVLSDIMTVMEHKDEDIRALKIAWVGDGNNVAHSWIQGASRLGFVLALACPEGYEPNKEILNTAQAKSAAPITLMTDPKEAVKGADVINADVWASMGQEQEASKRREIFAPFQINEALLAKAKKDAIVLHCLPAHRGEEISEEVLEGPHSLVWDQAENKMHLHKAVLEWAMEL